jgi:hypothetical protein
MCCADTCVRVLYCYQQRAFTRVWLHNTAVRRVAAVRTARDNAWAWDKHQRTTLALHVQVPMQYTQCMSKLLEIH